MNDSGIFGNWDDKIEDETKKGCPTMTEGIEDARFLQEPTPPIMFSRSEVLEIKKYEESK